MQSGTSYRLVVRRGPQPNQQFLLTRDTVTLGRDITNDIVINDPEVSRHHARLIRTPNGYSYEDLRSTNGSFVNRQRLSAPYQLQNGDLLGLGETITLVYEVVGEAAATMVAPSGGSAAPQPMPAPAARPAPAPVAADVDDEEYQPDRNRWIVIGCGALTILLCCAVVVGIILIDSTKSWCSIPMIGPLVGCP
jgi:predicted component of type VI protein secretion system